MLWALSLRRCTWQVKTPAFEDIHATPARTPRLREVPTTACITPRHSKGILCSPPAWTLQSYLVSHGSVAKLSEPCWFVLLYVSSPFVVSLPLNLLHALAPVCLRQQTGGLKKREEEENPSQTGGQNR